MEKTISKFSVGEIVQMSKRFTKKEVNECSKLTDDYCPLYSNKELTKHTRFKQPIVPGLLTEGLINATATTYLPGPGSVLLQKELVYGQPIFVNDVITASLEVTDIDFERDWVTQRVVCRNQNNVEVVSGQVVFLTEELPMEEI